MILALLWKEFRETLKLLGILVVGVLLAAVVWVIAAFAADITIRLDRAVVQYCALLLPLAAAALLGARAFAGERSLGTDSFLDALPVNRSRVAVAKVSLNLAVVILLNVLCWRLIRPSRWVSLNPPEGVSFEVVLIAGQILLFGVSHLASALSERPVRSLFVAPVILICVVPLIAAPSFSFLILTAVHSAIAPDHSLLSVESLLEGVVPLAGLTMLGIAPVMARREPSVRQWLLVGLLLGLALVLTFLPFLQFLRLWGRSEFHELLGAYHFEPEVVVWAVAVAGLAMLCAAIDLEGWGASRQRTGPAWSGMGSVACVGGAWLLVGWLLVLTGRSGRVEVTFRDSSYTLQSPGHADLFVVRSRGGYYANARGPCQTLSQFRTVLLREGGKDALALPGRGPGRAVWSPDGRYVAWSSSSDSLLLKRHSVGVLDTRASRARLVEYPSHDELGGLVWASDSTRLFCLTARHVGGSSLDEDRRLACRLWAVRTAGTSLRLKEVARWTSEPSGVPGWRPWPWGMAMDGGDILVFVKGISSWPGKQHSRSVPVPTLDRAPECGLYRAHLSNGVVEPDPAFERLREAVKERAGNSYVDYQWKHNFSHLHGVPDKRFVRTDTHDAAAKTSWSGVWLLGYGGKPNRLVAELEEQSYAPIVLLGDDSCILGRGGRPDTKGASEWRIVRRIVGHEEETVLLTIPLASHVSIDPSPMGRWAIVSAWHQSLPGHGENWNGSWLVATDGAFVRGIENHFLFSGLVAMWAPDDSVFLWHDAHGLYALEPRRDAERSTCKVRTVVTGEQFPDLAKQLRVLLSADGRSAYVLSAEGGYAECTTRLRLTRIDVRTGEPELLLQFDGDRWIGGKTLTVREAKID